MPKSEDEPEKAIEPVPHSEHHAVRFGAHVLELLGAVLIAYVILHFITKYW
jgi:hypothetical protein